MTPVKSQEQYGSCWALSTTSSLECDWFIAGDTVDSACNSVFVDNGFVFAEKNDPCTRPVTFTSQSRVLARPRVAPVDRPGEVWNTGTSTVAQHSVPIAVATDQRSFQSYSSGVLTLHAVGALAHRGLPPFIGGLCGDLSPHRTTMTQTKCCPFFCILGCGGVPIKWLLPEPSRTRGLISALVLLFFLLLLRRSTPAFRLGVPGSVALGGVRRYSLQRYGRRSRQPSSSSLARRSCVHYSGWITTYCTTPLVFVPFSSSTGTP